MSDKQEQYGWMKVGYDNHRAHGPFDSIAEALADAKQYFPLGEEVLITINTIFMPNFLNHIPDADGLVCQASDAFDGDYGSSDELIFDLAGDNTEATQELREALKEWATKWVDTSVNWFMTKGDCYEITGTREQITTEQAEDSVGMHIRRVSKCVDCLLIDQRFTYEWSTYGCLASSNVSDEMSEEDVKSGIPDECPLRKEPILLTLETNTKNKSNNVQKRFTKHGIH